MEIDKRMKTAPAPNSVGYGESPSVVMHNQREVGQSANMARTSGFDSLTSSDAMISVGAARFKAYW